MFEVNIKFRILNQSIDVVWTKEGMRACDERQFPITSAPIVRYLQNAFGPNYARVYGAMKELALSYGDVDRLDAVAYDMYTKFRPEVPAGSQGWGAKGLLDIEKILALKQPSRA